MSFSSACGSCEIVPQGADLALPAPLCYGDGDRFFVDIEPHDEDRFIHAFVG
jgi:hypothetical protein